MTRERSDESACRLSAGFCSDPKMLVCQRLRDSEAQRLRGSEAQRASVQSEPKCPSVVVVQGFRFISMLAAPVFYCRALHASRWFCVAVLHVSTVPLGMVSPPPGVLCAGGVLDDSRAVAQNRSQLGESDVL